jgi:hypothetical protein
MKKKNVAGKLWKFAGSESSSGNFTGNIAKAKGK